MSTLAERQQALRRAIDLADGRLPHLVLGQAKETLNRLSERAELAPDHTVVALLGATGSGKSSLLNALVGEDIARTAATRPVTREPLAVAWGRDAGGLLDWLQIAERAERPDDNSGLVLVDLPDIDSTEARHREIAARLSEAVDVLVWVLDPQKYADAVVHQQFLRPLAANADVTLVVLNQIDRLEVAARPQVMGDIARLLADDGLPGVRVLPTSARTGEGVSELRAAIDEVARGRRARLERASGDVTRAAEKILEAAGGPGLSSRPSGEAGGGSTMNARPAAGRGRAVTASLGNAPLGNAPLGAAPLGAAARTRLIDAASKAAGVPAIEDAVRADYLRRARRQVGWIPVRWLAGLRPSPLKRLHLDRAPVQPGTGRTSVTTGVVAEAAVRSAAHEVVGTVTRDLPDSWRIAVTTTAQERIPVAIDGLDARLADTDLERDRRPGWWGIFGILQWVTFIAAVVGGLWLAGLGLLGYLRLPEPETPMVWHFPLPTVLLLGGILLGILLAGLGMLLAGSGARRTATRVGRRLRATVAEGVTERLIAPLEQELEDYQLFRESLGLALRS